MKPKFILCLALVLSGYLLGCSTTTPRRSSGFNTAIDKNLTKQISDTLFECQKIKLGMTRAELLKYFMTEGGLWTEEHQTFVYRRCPYIQVDVDFTPSDPKQKMTDEQPTDIISKISKPYLDWSIGD